MHRVIISGIGVEIPEASIGNDELVESFNAWVDSENPKRQARGEEPLQKSDSEFIVYASGVKRRHVHTLDGILDALQRNATTLKIGGTVKQVQAVPVTLHDVSSDLRNLIVGEAQAK